MAKAPQAQAGGGGGRRTFTDILDTPSDEVSRPRPVPQGSYITMVKGLPREDISTKKGTPFSEYILQMQEPVQNDNGDNSDVDPDELKLALTKANGDVIPLRERSVRYTLFNTEDALYRHKKFLDDCGIPQHDDDGSVLTIRERIALVPNRVVGVYIKHVPSEDGETIYANVGKTFKLSQ